MVTLVSVSIWLIGRPIFELFLPAFVISPNEYYTAGWAVPFVMIGGVLLLTATMQLAKYAGRLHSHFAKAMLVSE